MNESNLRSDPSIALPAVVITGATEGIGRALAEEFARDGHALVLVARDQAKLAKTAEELARAHGVEVKVTAQDLSTPEGCAGVEQAVRGFGFYAEYLVNNAGIMSSGFFQDEDLPGSAASSISTCARWSTSPCAFSRGCLRAGRGGVLNLSSMMGYMPVPYQATYAASKAFILSFSKALSYETRGTGVKVSVVAPGVVSTGLHDKAGAQNSRYLVWFPPLTPEQVANKAYRRFKRGWSVTMSRPRQPAWRLCRALHSGFCAHPADGVVLPPARRRRQRAMAASPREAAREQARARAEAPGNR